jgi:hypothetical protein
MSQYIYKLHIIGISKPKLIEARNIDQFRTKLMKVLKRSKIEPTHVWRVEKFELQGNISQW